MSSVSKSLQFPCFEFISASWDREQKQITGSVPVRINFKSITMPPPSRGKKQTLNLRVSVYDIAFKQFIGRTCHCPPVSVDGQNEIKLDQSVYIHTSFNDVNVILCFEVVFTFKENRRQVSFGWGIIRIFKNPDAIRTTPLDVSQTLSVFKGTPRALLFMEDPIENNSFLRSIPGCRVNYTLQIHKPLVKVQHLLPVNVLFGGSEPIPGVMEPGNFGDSLKRPRTQKSVLLVLDHLTVNFPSDVEDDVCRHLDMDRHQVHQELPVDGSRTVVVERRLKIGVHNGFTYLKEPQIVHLALGKDPKNRDGKSKWFLTHQNKIKLPEMAEDVQLSVIFVFEFVVSSPVTVTDRKMSVSMALSRTQTSTIVVRWTSWKPFLSTDSSEIKIKLTGGISHNPDRVLIFSPEMGDGDLKFTSVIRKRRDSGSSERTVKLSESNGPSSLPVTLPGRPPISPRRRLSKQRSHKRSHSDGSRRNGPSSSLQSSVQTASESEEIVPIPCATGPYVPILKTSSHLPSSGHGLSRAAYARLYGAGIPTILDRNGKPAEVVNLGEDLDFSMNRELTDPLKTNVIVLQFLAFSCRVISGSPRNFSVPKMLKFTFQFFRFPPTVTDQLLVSTMEIAISSDTNGVPCLLQRVGVDGSVEKGPVGYEVKFGVDRDFFEESNRGIFTKYLLGHHLHIDVWDADSLLHIGSASTELKHLCRQGKEAVQVTYELDIRYNDFCDDASSSTMVTRGCVHLRMANIGYPKSSKKLNLPSRTSMVERKQIGLTDSTIARSYLELDKRLSAEVNILQRVDEGKPNRKISRMEAVRALRAKSNPANTRCWIDPSKERLRRIGELKVVEAVRERNKHQIISGLLFETFAKEITLDAVPGRVTFFEFDLVNPWKNPHTVTIESEDVEELRIITSNREWMHFKKYSKSRTVVEENMFNGDGETPQMFIGPRERVCLPFRYRCTSYEVSSSDDSIEKCESHSQQRSLKVLFRTSEGKIMSILSLRVEIQPPTVEGVFHFHCAEKTYVKKSLRIPPTESGTNISISCSDPQVICEVADYRPGSPVDIFFKLSTAPCCTSKKFYLFIYEDEFKSCPSLVWLIVIHSMQRVDVTCVQNERRQQSLILRGSYNSKMVKCFSSHPAELFLNPADPFLLAAGTVHELSVMIVSRHAGVRYIYINVVDVEFHQLVHSWMVCVNCQPPVLTRAFQIQLPLGGGKGSNKRLPFTNPYFARRKFSLNTSRPDLLHFKESHFEVGPKQSHVLGLVFLPNFTAGQVDILVFIQDEDDRNEETFCVKANYV